MASSESIQPDNPRWRITRNSENPNPREKMSKIGPIIELIRWPPFYGCHATFTRNNDGWRGEGARGGGRRPGWRSGRLTSGGRIDISGKKKQKKDDWRSRADHEEKE